MYQGCFKDVSRMFQGCFKDVSRMFQECFKDVSRVSQRYLKVASKEDQAENGEDMTENTMCNMCDLRQKLQDD